MKVSEYIKQFTKEVKVNSLFNDGTKDTIIVSVPNECYLTLKSEHNKLIDDNLLKFLASHEIFDVESNFKHPSDNRYPVANTGFSKKENKWYGWSHRAVYGFSIGSKVKKGDCAYVPYSKEDYIDDCIRFWSEEDHLDIHAEDITSDSFNVVWTYSDKVPNESIRGTIGSMREVFPKKYGKGEWEAKTIEDAKQMAIDFAESVA